ncbi:MAG: phage shock protein operon transcriptional activator [Pseudomonadales bacterium]
MQREAERLLGEAPSFLQILEEVSLAAPLTRPVLIVGERGTGKELIAARLHYLSNRWEGAYLTVNCAAISESLMESELFGHEVGAFTGATKARSGRFERAHGGTLFLDELATTSPAVQEKLLRVIEYGEFERLGGSKTLNCDVRIVAATNEDLPALAAAGEFRADLLDRLAFDVLTLPPLRERLEDIPLLAAHFGVAMASDLGRELFPGFSATAREAMLAHPWPGNVRELKNVVERSVYRWEEEVEIDEVIFDPFDSPYRPIGRKSDRSSASDHINTQGVPRINGEGTQFPVDLKSTLKDYEVALVSEAMAQSKHNQRKAAQLLGLTYHQLRGVLKKYDLLNSEPVASS